MSGALQHHLQKLIDAEIEAGARPIDVVDALLGATGATLRRAGHKNIDNIAGQLGAMIALHVRAAALEAQD